MTGAKDYTDDFDIETGDTLAIDVESDEVPALNGHLEITARSDLGPESYGEGAFAGESLGNRVKLKTESGQTLILVIRAPGHFWDDDVVAKIELHGDYIAEVSNIEVLD